MNRMGNKETAAELQPQVAAIRELNTQEPLATQLDVIWRTPKRYHLMSMFASDASREQILKYYSHELEKDGWENEEMSEFHQYDTNELLSQTYTWSKNGYNFEIIFDLVDGGTKETYTEDGKLQYYINVVPESMKQQLSEEGEDSYD